jgi:hypothetical protein
VAGGNYEGAEKALNNYFNLYGESEDYFYKNLYNRALQVQLYELLGADDVYKEAEEVLTYAYQHTMENPELDDYDYRDLEAGKNILEGILFHHLDSQDLHIRKSYYEGMQNVFPGAESSVCPDADL